ncbi:ATP-, maltotriose-and DNA-dependent transcriptional regulator MalT [Lentzea fradiae]|uniref:ATP-, maltotriose-and DNA-dependent transcriptional regulator MalT n=1 Tax=Lentzea fradiae TaxID=200378 RepID=A0A1G8CNC4_9PSEU|nr:AAA family ATPase [Lentzea fradiae]SDH46789.1 ATP-, maltotriose-and DNA-dependent transcriptional regulator MalT [Lentzea fradiae]
MADEASRCQSGTTLVGRTAELTRISEALAAASAGTPSALLLAGPTGIGKTTLLKAACGAARERGFLIGRAAASPMEREMPFAVVQQLFEHLSERLPPDDADQVAKHGRDVIGGTLGEAQTDFGDLHVHRAIRGVYRVAAELTRHGPLCLVIDDVQWVDVPSLRWLNYFLHRMTDLPVVVLVTRTSGLRATDPLLVAELRMNGERLELPGISAEDVVALTEQVLGQPPDEVFVTALLTATGGNPLVVRQLLTSMRGQSVPPDRTGVHHLGKWGPEVLGESVLARLNRQSPGLVRTATAIAVVEPADADLLAAITGVDLATIRSHVRELRGMGVLAPADKLAFAHSVIKNAVENATCEEEKQRLHATTARLLHGSGASSVMVARHAQRSAAPLGRWAAESLQRSANALIAEGDPRSAAKFLRRALQEEVTPDLRRDLLLRLGLAETYFAPRDAVGHLEEAMRELEDPEQILSAAYLLAQVFYVEGEYDRASKMLRRTMDEIKPKIPSAVDVLRLVHQLTVPAPRTAQERVDLRQIDREDWTGDDARSRLIAAMIAESASSAGTELSLGRDAALAALSRGPAELLGHPQRLLASLNALIRADELDLALRYCDETLLEAQREGLVLLELFGHTLRSRTHYHRGAAVEAAADSKLALSAARSAALPADHFGCIYAADAHVRALLLLGDVDTAREVLEPYGLSAPMPRTWQHTALLHARGAVRMELGDPVGALADQLECGGRFKSWGLGSPAVRPWRSHAARAMFRLGRRQQALELALQELELAREWGAPTAAGLALLTVASVSGGNAGPWLREAESLLRDSPARLLYAQVMVEIAAMEEKSGRAATAQSHLAEARKIGEQRNVLLAPRRATAPVMPEVVPAGPRMTPQTLTPHEYRVARLVLEGNSNNEIAQRLSVSRRTIEFHLTSIYRKLGLRRRTQLSAALAGLEPKT